MRSVRNSYSGFLTIKRTANLATCAGFTPDGTTVAASQNNIVVTSNASANVITYGQFTFSAQLQDLPNYTEFTTLYDRYTIIGVSFRLYPFATNVATGAAVGTTSQQSSCLIHTVFDYDDDSAPTATDAGINALRQYKNYRVYNPFAGSGRGLKRYFKPRIQAGVWDGGALASAKNVPFGYIDCDSPDIHGFGMKAIVEVLSGGSALSMFLKGEATYYLKFKDPR